MYDTKRNVISGEVCSAVNLLGSNYMIDRVKDGTIMKTLILRLPLN